MTWAKLALVLNQHELEWLRRYFSDSKCRFSYAKDGSRREIDERASSQISLLCYSISKPRQDAFLQNPLLTRAFLAARPEIIELSSRTAFASKTIAVVQKFSDLCEMFEAEVHAE